MECEVLRSLLARCYSEGARCIEATRRMRMTSTQRNDSIEQGKQPKMSVMIPKVIVVLKPDLHSFQSDWLKVHMLFDLVRLQALHLASANRAPLHAVTSISCPVLALLIQRLRPPSAVDSNLLIFARAKVFCASIARSIRSRDDQLGRKRPSITKQKPAWAYL